MAIFCASFRAATISTSVALMSGCAGTSDALCVSVQSMMFSLKQTSWSACGVDDN